VLVLESRSAALDVSGDITTSSSPSPSAPARVPRSLRDAASFPPTPDARKDAAAWARVLRIAAKELSAAARESSSWDHETQVEVLTALDEAARLTAVAKSPVLAAQEARGAWRQAGVRSFADLRARTTRAGRGAARREVEAARAVQELEGGLDALASGAMTTVHAERLGAIAGRLPEEQQEALLTGEGARAVKRLAERYDATRFARKVEDLAASLSARELENAHQDARRRRRLDLTSTADGMTRVTGLLDAVAGHTLQLALDAASPRPGADDQRTRGQRQADALHELASAMLAEPQGPGNARPHVLVTMSAETFRAAREHLAAATHTPSHDEADRAAGLPAAPAVRLQDGPLLPLSELGRVLCDSSIARLVIAADSEPLDLGRSQRVFTPAQRRAVIARDGGCAWEGCAMPARYCEVHHLDWWDADHGHTDVSRGVLVCVFHHHELHRHHLDLVRIEATGPPGKRHTRPPAIRRAGPDPNDQEGPTPQGRAGPAAQEHPPQDLLGRADALEPGRARYRTVPRATTRTQREEARRARLLADARSRRRGRQGDQSAPGDQGAPGERGEWERAPDTA